MADHDMSLPILSIDCPAVHTARVAGRSSMGLQGSSHSLSRNLMCMKSLPPDAFAAVAIALALLLEWVVPVRVLPEASLASVVSWIGVAIALIGLGLEVAAARALASAGTTTRAGAVASSLVTSGPFGWSRNPFYVGLLLVLAGGVVAFSLDWGLLTVPLVAVALDRIVIPREEAMLRERFAGFEAYAADVGRWVSLPRR